MVRAILLSVVLTVATVRAEEVPASQPASRPTSQPAALVVATYNINFELASGQQFEDVVAAIEQTDADVVAIQEGNAAVYQHLRQHFANAYPYMQFYPGHGAAGFGWLSRLPLSNKRIIRHHVGCYDSAVAEVTVGDQTVTMATVHLQPFPDPGKDDTVATMLKTIACTEMVRRQEIELIRSKLPADGPVIILGDFNGLSTMAAALYLKDKGFTDSFGSVEKEADDDEHCTWRSLRPGEDWRYRIDYVWHTRQLKTVKSQVLTAGPSDHYPVVSELELVAGEAGAVAGAGED